MPDMPLQCALRDSVEEVLEKMFFVEAVDGPVDSTPGGEGSPNTELVARLTFEGSPSGVLTLRVTDAAARQIAADFLGEDESGISSAKVGEVACELANMICGSVLSRVEGATTFRLGPPLLIAEPWRPCLQSDRQAIHVVALGNGTLTAIVETRETVCPAAEEFAS